ncbi:EamA family transporter RarD [Lentibacillus sp. N15]|uniref:EamA family transporter RarD n=1 Tax=Lentibacillus songyuanensis TaxID=3136161 RepID=UPI0031BA9CFA
MKQAEQKMGIIYITFAYIFWGILPIYWKLVDNVQPGTILAHRIIWSFLFMIAIILVLKKWSPFIAECKAIFKNKKKLIGISSASFIISLNWLTYIWAVNTEHVIQASLGYYMNPLVSILLGMIILKERLTRQQLASFLIAAIGVIYLAVSYGVFPWISLALAITFGLYGLLKKTVDIGAMFGLAMETMIVTPLALIYVAAVPAHIFTINNMSTSTPLLLIGAGVATAIPLLLFASGAKQIPLSMVGFLQYIAPTIMLLLGVFLYHETFTHAHMVSFAFIWIALIIYMTSVQHRPAKKRKKATS